MNSHPSTRPDVPDEPFKWGSTVKANQMTKEILSLKSVMRGLDDSRETLSLTEFVHGLKGPQC